jgi:hypothetical protein
MPAKVGRHQGWNTRHSPLNAEQRREISEFDSRRIVQHAIQATRIGGVSAHEIT